jgi:tight adherence protein B
VSDAATLDGGIILAVFATVAMLLLMTTVTLAAVVVLRPRMRLRRRMADLGLVNTKGGSQSGAGANARQRRIQEKLQELEDKGKERSRRNQIRADLLQAGLDTNIKTYLIASGVVGVVAALVLLIMGMSWLVILPGAAIAAFGLPKVALRFMANSRQKKFTKEFANAIDVLVRGIKSGLPVGECLNIIGRESPDPVGEEFRLLVGGQKIGVGIDELLRRGLERMPTPEYKFFAIVLQIQQQTGGNLAETLDNLSNVLRERKKMRDKVTAVSSEAKSSAMIIGCLPFFVMGMISLINPDYMALLFTTRTGNFLIGGGMTWMLTGIGVMWKMINFKM